MGNIKDIIQEESVIMPSITTPVTMNAENELYFMKRIQGLKTGYSAEFDYTESDFDDISKDLPLNYVEVTLKKVICNLIVANRLRNRKTDETLLEILKNNPSFRFYKKSFYYAKS
ncbi:hypothetical protein [Viridibacillus arvi]|uniref:hypothetical protein n=1 Tax=Viridibacillus arvi TaxID=263475 RepID=UPI003D01A6E1